MLFIYLQLAVVVVAAAVVAAAVAALASFYQCNILVLRWDTECLPGLHRKANLPMRGCICPDIRLFRPSL